MRFFNETLKLLIIFSTEAFKNVSFFVLIDNTSSA